MASLEPSGEGWTTLLRRAEERLGAVGAPITGAQEAALCAYLDELVVWSRRTDLTAARTAEELVDLTLADASVVVRGTEDAFGDEVRSFVDVGAGAGAPGLIVGILRPTWRGDLIEPRQRRVAFLRTAVGRLSLSLGVERTRSDTLMRADWDVAMARATLPPPEWLAEGARLGRRGVWVLLARDAPPSLAGWEIVVDRSYALPLTGAGRRAVCYAPRA